MVVAVAAPGMVRTEVRMCSVSMRVGPVVPCVVPWNIILPSVSVGVVLRPVVAVVPRPIVVVMMMVKVVVVVAVVTVVAMPMTMTASRSSRSVDSGQTAQLCDSFTAALPNLR